MECAAIVGSLRVENRMDINEYVDIDKDMDCFGDYANEEIIRVVKEVYEEISSDENVVEEKKNITEESVCDLWKRFTEMANDICTILLQDGSTDPTIMKNANELKRFGLQKFMANKKQGTLDRYFK
ncbi:hypothetical protein HZS_2996 [Henneguya salminicola]|nr:hypothetical protein HZS_2996 [Henneguya salminicola]